MDVIACGKKAGGFFKFRGVTPVLDFKDLSADPTFEEASEIADYAVKAYEEGSVDEVVLVYNHCKNAAEQVLREEVILPVDTEAVVAAAAEETSENAEVSASVEFEPEPGRCARASSARLPAHVDLPCVDRLCCWRAGRTPHGNALGYRERQRDGGNAVESV